MQLSTHILVIMDCVVLTYILRREFLNVINAFAPFRSWVAELGILSHTSQPDDALDIRGQAGSITEAAAEYCHYGFGFGACRV